MENESSGTRAKLRRGSSTEWSRPNMSLFFDDALNSDSEEEDTSADSGSSDAENDVIERMATSHDYFKLDKLDQGKAVDDEGKNDGSAATNDGKKLKPMPVSTSIAPRLVLFTTRFGRPPTTDETVQILDGELHLHDHEEEEAARLKKEKEQREKEIEERKEQEAALQIEEAKRKASEIQRKKSFNGDRFQHAAYLLKAEHHVMAALQKKKSSERMKQDLKNKATVSGTKVQDSVLGSKVDLKDNSPDESKNETKEDNARNKGEMEGITESYATKDVVEESKNEQKGKEETFPEPVSESKETAKDEPKRITNPSNTKDGATSSKDTSNMKENIETIEKKPTSGLELQSDANGTNDSVKVDIENSGKVNKEKKITVPKSNDESAGEGETKTRGGLLSPERLLQTKWNFTKKSRKREERMKLKRKKEEEAREKAQREAQKRREEEESKKKEEEEKLKQKFVMEGKKRRDEETKKRIADEKNKLEIEKHKAQEEHRQIQEELRIAKEQKLQLIAENKRLEAENRSKLELSREATATTEEQSSAQDEDSLDIEREKLLNEVHLAKQKLAVMEKKILNKKISKQNLDSTDNDFSPGSIVPQRPREHKASKKSSNYASGRRRHTRMSRRKSPVIDETVEVAGKKIQNKIKRRKSPEVSSSEGQPSSNIHGRPRLPARISLDQRPLSRTNRRFSYSKSVLNKGFDTSFRRKQSPKRKKSILKKRELQRSKTLEKNWVNPISSSPVPALKYTPKMRQRNSPRRPQSARTFRRSRTMPRNASKFKLSSTRSTLNWRHFAEDKISDRRLNEDQKPKYGKLQSGGDHRGSSLEEVFPFHPKVEKCRWSLLSAVETWGKLSSQAENAAVALCKEYNGAVMEYLASNFTKSKLHFKAKHHKRDDSVISENTNMMNENSTNDMLTRALNLTSKKGFLSSSERLRLRFRSTTLNNIACFHSACGRPRMAIRSLWEARLLSWDEQQDTEGQARVLDGPEIRTMLNMSSIYNRMGEYQKSLKVLIKACNSLRKIADGTIFEANELNNNRIQANQLELLPIALYSKGCTHEHLKQWHKATKSFAEGLDYATRLLGTDHSLVQQLEVAYDEAKDEMGRVQEEREMRRSKMSKRFRKKRSSNNVI